MFTKTSIKTAFVCCLLSSIFFSCKKEMDHTSAANRPTEKNTGKAPNKGTMFYALTASNELVAYISGNPLIERSSMSITGLQVDEKILAIDFRPATGQLYGVSNQSRIYIINLNSGVASPLGASFAPAINGTSVGLDFNPTVDRIRLVTNMGQNLRLNPETGLVVATDGNISPSTAMVSAAAYTNSFAGAATTTLYDIDVATDKLYIQNPPNNGTLVEVGSLGIQADGEAGFDIAADNSVAIAALYGRGYEDGQDAMSNGNKYRFYYIDLATGVATNAGKTDRQIIGVAIPTMPVAYAVDNSNRLLIMNPSTGTVVTKNITGIDAGDMIVGIDMRPVSAQLYALGANSRLYTINLATGAAAAVGASAFATPLNGTSFGFDFNPTVDRIRVVSNTGQNLRLHPVTGGVAAVDPNLNPGTPSVDAVAYINSFIGSTTTILYDIDASTDMLYQQNPANAGTLINGKSLGINIDADNGFDIGGTSNKAWGVFKVGAQTGLYNVDLATGQATYMMAVPYNVKGFAVGLGF
ncbi:DUF4394 domain-containing protein [Ferruginibacter sp. SUN002]|uniref:DUF4394 domain-containing protein n=1 Tax=Ferruginibacter sp. SUN002 TaxID=2937789 RepID=UPI003D3645D5